jgi:hypothetical protein
MKALKKWGKGLQLVQTAALALAVAGGLAGCSTPGYQKSDAAAVSMFSASTEVQAESQALEQTRTALNDLVNNPAPDLKFQFHRYCVALDQLTACAHRTESTGKTMARKSDAYFAAWDKQLTNITYEVIRSSSSARRTEARGVFDKVNQRYQDTQAVVWPMIAYLGDIRKALSTDLTQSGVKAIQPVATHANENMDKVQTALGALTAALADARIRFSSFVATVQNTH